MDGKKEEMTDLDKSLEAHGKSFMRVAINTLGRGYVEDYYDQTICSELRWAFTLGWEASKKAGNS